MFHPYHLAEQMDDEATTCTALLHDVVEDTDVTLKDLAQEFPAEIIDALRLLTHQPGVPYLDYVRALATNPIARAVKRADLRHNMDETRYAGGAKPLIDHWMPGPSEAHPTTSRIIRPLGLRMRPFSCDPYLVDSSHTRRSWSGLQSS